MNSTLANLTISGLSNAIGECIGMNTYKDKKFVCRCLPGFPFGDPVSKEGCYRCDESCHSHGYCQYPGVCKCFRGLVGDGVHECNVPVPEVTGIYPSIVRPEGLIESRVTYYIDEPYTPSLFFCKFGVVTVAGTLIQPGFGTCIIPPSAEHAVRVSLSFDGENYSSSDVFLRYQQREKNDLIINWIPIIATAMVFSWCNLIVLQWSKNPTGNKRIEEQQLYQQQGDHQIHAFDKNREEKQKEENIF